MTELQVLNENKWRTIFNKYDHNRDGHISFGELRDILKSEEYDKDIPKHVVKVILRDADVNRDGVLDFQEFLKMIENPENDFFFSNLKNIYVTKYVKLFVPQQDAVDGAYEEEYSCWPPPLFMILISLIEICLYMIDLSQGNSGQGQLGPIADVLIYKPVRRLECWRFLSYMFVHIGWMHLVVNIFVQLMLGIPLEMVHGGFRVLGVYVVGVIAGSLGTSITDPGVMLAGASGGVYALMTAHIASIVMNWKEMSFPLVQLLILVLVMLCDVGTAIYDRYFLDKNDSIGYAAHFFGALTGLLIGMFVLRNLRKTKTEKKVVLCAIVISILLIGSAIIVNIVHTNHFPPQEI